MKKKPLLIYLNPNSSGVKEFTLSLKKICVSLLIILALIVISLKYSVSLIADISENSKISQLKKENVFLQTQFEEIERKMSAIRTNIDVLEDRDEQIRAMLDLPSITADVRQVGIGGTDPDINIPINSGELSIGNKLFPNLKILEKLEREIRLEQESYQKLLTTVERHQDSLRYLPALKPVHNAYLSSAFGYRLHPIRKKRHFHMGVDLATNEGTPIIAPADGQVISARRNGGFGLFIQINHKYGFITTFGHLSKTNVRKGQYVKRGDKIGEVGHTGLATSSHLHYEISFKGKALNPLNFFLNDIEY